jgi:NAD(P)-dependent dehydrogenase (short-subunit alcohol dehydrogenase family)
MTNIFDKFSLKGQAAIVTGGAGLLGKEFCKTLAQAGAGVIVADLNGDAANKVAEEICREGGLASGVSVNVTDPASTQAMVAACLTAYGRLDVLVCSAALDPKVEPGTTVRGGGTFEDYPLDQWKQALDVNLTGLFLSAQAASKPMLAQNSGSMVFICSTYGLSGPDQRIYRKPGQDVQPYKPVYYSVTKAGVLGLVRYLATYYAGKNIRANALTPGGVFNNHDDTFVQNYSYRAVMGRMANKDEMNGALLYLASEASSYMTGSNLVVDGGWTAW